MLPLLTAGLVGQISVEDYRVQIETFREMAQAAGIHIPRASERDWEQLKKVPEERQQAIFRYFSVYFSVCQDVLSQGDRLTQSRQLVWRMIGKLGLRPAAELFNHIAENDVIEIYDRNGFQIFRNLAFFSVSSYSFEQLMHYPFEELFSRPAHCMTKLFAEIGSVLSGNSGPILFSNVGQHIARELISDEQFEATIDQKILSPLYDAKGNVAAFIATLRIISLQPTAGLPKLRGPSPHREAPVLGLA